MADGQRTVEFNGIRHVFPGDATDDEVRQALDSHAKGRAPTEPAPAQPAPVTQFEQQNQMPKDYGFTPGNVASNIWQGAKGAVTGAAALGKDLLSNPNWVEGPTSTLSKFVTQPAEAERQKSNEAFQQGHKWEAFGHGLASDLPFVGPWAASLGEQAGTGDIGGAAGQAAGALATAKLGGEGLKAARNLDTAAIAHFKGGILEATYDALNRASSKAKAKLWDVHNAVGQQVGALQKDIAAADYAEGEPKIATTDFFPKLDEIAKNYKGALPKLQAVLDRFANKLPTHMWYEELASLKTELGNLSAKMPEGSADRAAMEQVTKMIGEKTAARADELGQSQKLERANGLWKTLKSYEDPSQPMGKLLNANDGAQFFDALRSKANATQLARVNDSLSEFGLPKRFFSDLVDQHKVGHDYVASAGKQSGFGGKFKALGRHPIAGGAGFLAGQAAGGWLGGMFGAGAASNLVDAVKAAKYLKDTGGAPSLVGEMKGLPQVQPSGEGLTRPESASAFNPLVNEVASALKNSGFSKQQAMQAARNAVSQFPNDFDSAVRNAYEGASRRQQPIQAEPPEKQTRAEKIRDLKRERKH